MMFREKMYSYGKERKEKLKKLETGNPN